MPFKIGWVSTGRGQGSMNLLNAMVKAIKEGEVNGELSFVVCSREQGEAEGGASVTGFMPDRFLPLNPKPETRNPKLIGVLGGTFDPIHYGHLRPALEAVERLGLSELRLMPAFSPPHRAPPVATPAQRLHMVELAIAGLAGMCTDDRELRRGGPSYTVLTLHVLRAELGITPLCLLIGTDQLRGFESWFHWQEIPRLAHLVVLERPGCEAGDWPGWVRDQRQTADLAALQREPAGRLAFLAVNPQDISSTGIRERLARGESVAGLVPDAVREYIHANAIYGRPDRGV